jgi:hypothetical protein
MSFIKTHFKQLKLWLGAVGNGSIAQGSVTLTAHCNLTQADVGNPVWILGAGANHAPHRSHIVSVASATSCTIADASPFASPGYPSLGTAIVIVWRQRDYLPETLNCSLSLSTQSSLSFTVLGTVPHGCPVILGIDNANNLVFGGVVSRDRLTVVSNKQDVFTECECVSWQYALGRQFTDEKTYDNTTAGAVFQALLNSPRVAVDYVGYNVQDVGAFIESVAFGTENLWDALQRLVDLSNTPSDKFYIYVDPYRVAHFRKQTAIAAPWVLTKDGSILLNYNVIKTSEKRINRVVVKGSQVLGDTVSERFYGNGSVRTFYTAASIGSEPIILRNGAPQTVGIYGIDTGRDWYWNSGSNALRQDPAGTVLTATDFLDVSYRGFQYQSAEAQNTTDQAEARAAEGGSGIYWHHVAVTTPTTAEGLQGLAQAWVTKYAGKAVQVDIDTYRSGLLPGQKITVQLDDAATSGEYLIESASIQVRRAYVVWSVRCTSALLGDWRKPFLDLTDLAGITPHSEQTAPPTIPGAPNILNATAEAYYTDQDWYEEESGRFLAFRGTITLPTALPNYAYLYQIRVYAISDAPGSSRREIAVIPRSQFTDVVIDWDTSKLEPRPKSNITYDLEFVADNGSAQTASPFMVQNVQVLGQPEAPDLPLSLTVMEAIAERFIDDAFVTHTVLYPTPVFATGTRAKRIRYYLSLNNGATYGFPGSPDGFLGEREVGDNKGLVLPVPSSNVPTARMKAITLNDYGTNDLSNAVVSSPFAIQGYLPLPSTTVQGAGATYSVDQNKSLWAFYPQVTASIPTRPAHFAKVELRLKLYNGSGQLSPDPRYAGKGLLLKEWISETGAITWTATLELPPPTEPANGYRRYRFEFWGITKAAQETLCTAWTGGATYGELYVSESWATPPPEPPALPVSITVTEAIAERRLDHQNNVKTFLDPVVTLPDDSGAEWLEFWLSLDNGVTYKFDGSPTGWLGERWTYESLRFEIYVPRGGSVTARMKVISHSTRGRNDIADAVVSPPFTIAGLGSVPETGAITEAEIDYSIDPNYPGTFSPTIRWKNNPVPPLFASLLTVKLCNADGDVFNDPKYQETPFGQVAMWSPVMGQNQYSSPNGWGLPLKSEPENGYRYFHVFLVGETADGDRALTRPWAGGDNVGILYIPESREDDPTVTAGGTVLPNASIANSEFKGERLSVTMFGAKGDGVTNDAPAFAATIEAAVSVGGGEIFIPRGTYKLDEPVTLDSSVTRIKFTGCGSSSIVMRGADLPDGEGLFDIFGTDIEFANFTVDGQVTTPATMQYGQFDPNPMITAFTKNTSFWVHGGAKRLSWHRMTVRHTGGYAILLDATSDGDIVGVKISKSLFENNRPHLFGFDAGDLNYGSWTGGVHYQGDGANYAVSDLLVEGCTFRRNTGNCCWGHLYAFGKIHSNIRRKGNYFEDCGLDGILMGGEVGGCVEGNQFRRIGYICLDDSSASTPKRLQGAWAVAIDSAGLVRGVNVVGNTIVSANGGSIDLDGYSQGVISGNTCIMPSSGEPEYTEDKIAQTGPGGTGNNWTYGINAGNTNNIEIPGTGITVTGNTFINMGGGAIRMYCSRNSVIQGNNIIHPATANFPPIALGNTGTGPYQRARGNVVIENKIEYSPVALSAAVVEDASIAPFEATDKNWVAGNRLTGNCFEFQKHASSGSTSHVVISAVEHGLTTRSENIIQREGSGVYAVYRNYAVSAGGSLGLSSLFDHLTNGVNIIGGPLFNISRDGAAGTGSISTGPRTASQWDDAVLTGKLFSDSFLCMTGLTYSDAEANLMPDTYGLIRYDGTSHKFMFSDEVSSGVRVWKQFATLPSWVEFIPAQPPNGNILYVDGFFQSTGGFLTTGTAFNIIQAPYGGVTAKWLIGTDWFALTGVPGAGVELSNPGQGKIYFDSNLNRFRVSENAGAFKDLVGGFWQQKDAGPDIQYTAGNVWVSGRLLLNGAQLWGASPLVMKQVVGNPGFMVVDDTGVQPKNAHFGFDVNLEYLQVYAVHQNVQFLPMVFRCSTFGINTENPLRTLHISSSAYTEFLIESTGAASGYGRIWAFTLNPANKMLALRRGNDDFSSAIGVIQFYPGGEVVVGPNVITPDHTFEVQGKMKADSLFLDGTGTLITILGALTADHEGNLSVTGIFSADGGVYTTNTSYNAIQSPFGGVTTKWLIGTESLSLMGVTPAPVGVGANEGRIYFDSVTKKFRVSEGGGSWVNLVGGGGGGVTSLNGLTGALSVVAGTGVSVTALGSSITVAIGQPVGIGNAVQFYSVLTSDAIQSNRAIGPAIYAPNAWIQGKGLVSAGLTARNSIQSTSGIRAGTDGSGGFWIGSGVEANSMQVINTLGQFVGAGVLCPSYGIQAAGFNPTGYNGQTFTLDFSSSGGFAVSGYGTFNKIHFVGGVFVSLS